MPVAKGPNTANFKGCSNWNSTINGNVTSIGTNGGPSAYGTYDQDGLVWEWITLLENDGTSNRRMRGGSYWINSNVGSEDRTGPLGGGESGEDSGFRICSLNNLLALPNYITIAYPNNLPNNIYGAVNYIYQINQYVVTNDEYVNFLNSIAKTDTYLLYVVEMASKGGIIRSGTPGSYTYESKSNYANKPVIYISWFRAARYCNWLHNNKPIGNQNNNTTENGAYDLSTVTPNTTYIVKNPDAQYWIPTENEWYKAAYHKADALLLPEDSSYWTYATQSDTLPQCVCANSIGDGQPCCSISNNLLTNSTFDTTSGWQFVNVDRYRLGDYLFGGDLTNYQVDLNMSSPGYIEQTVQGLVNGGQYYVQFDLSANLAGGPRYRTMRLTLYDDLGYNVSQDYTFDTNGLTYSGTMASQGWQTKVFTFTAPGTSLFKIKLESTCSGCGNFGPLVDNVLLCGAAQSNTTTPTPTVTPTITPTITITPTPSFCPVDQYGDYVSLLLYFNGTNGSRNVIDSSQYNHQITTEGDAIISTDLSKFGNSSLFLDGSGDYITLPSDNSFSFGTNDFTVECWIYIVQYGSYHTQIVTTTGISTNFSFAVDNNGKLFYWNGSIGRSVGSFGDVPLNQWTHVAFSRENQTIRLYVNERLVGSLNDSTNLINTADICIGANETYPYSNICYLDELRVTKGVARYVANTLQQYCSHYINTTPTPTPTPTPSPGVTRTPTITPTITPSPTTPSIIVLPSQTKDELVIQLKDLVVNHKYKITLISDDSSSLDQSEFNFYATSSVKNIRTILVKNIFSKIVNVQILINDLTTETITSYPTFVKCYDYSECSVSCLSGYTYVDVIQNHYRFTFTNNMRFFHPDISLYKLGYGFGQYVLKDIPIDYPLAILNHGYESFITYYGDNSKVLTKNVDGIPYNFYYGDIGIQVNGIGPVPSLLSYTSYNNGYMGGQDRLIFNASCAVVTPTPTVTPTITPTVTRTPTPTPMFGMMSYTKPITVSWDDNY